MRQNIFHAEIRYETQKYLITQIIEILFNRVNNSVINNVKVFE